MLRSEIFCPPFLSHTDASHQSGILHHTRY